MPLRISSAIRGGAAIVRASGVRSDRRTRACAGRHDRGAAGVDYFCAEVFGYVREGGPSRLDDYARGDIGIDDRDAERGSVGGRQAAADATGESDDEHAGALAR